MDISNQLRERLHQLIGSPVMHQGIRCTVVEFLEHEPALVLASDDANTSLQDTQYGMPGRRVAEFFTIPLFDEDDNSQFHPELLQLGLLACE